MEIRLIFDRWRDKSGRDVSQTEEASNLSPSVFHAGVAFRANIDLGESDSEKMLAAMAEGFTPIFYAALAFHYKPVE